MNLGVIGKATGKFANIVSKNSTTILTIFAVGGVVATGVSAAKDTIKARDVIKAHEMDEELKTEQYESVPGEEMTGPIVFFRDRTRWEKVKLAWRCYIRTILIGSGTILCIVGAHSIDTKRRVALAAAYSLSEEAAKEFRDKVTETIGENKVKKIDTEIAQDHATKTPFLEENITHTGKGEEIMFDSWSGRYFKSSRTQVERDILALNKEMMESQDSKSVNDYYEAIGLPYLPNAVGEYFGWNFDIGNKAEDITVDFRPVFTPKQEPCTALVIKPELLYTYGDR